MSCSRNPVDQKGPEEMDNLCGAWKHTELGEMESTLMNMALLLEKEEERPPKTAVPISVRAADASVQSWRCRGLGLAVVQSRVRQPWCTAPLTAAAPRAAELQPHWGRGQRPPGWDLHAKGSRQGRLPYPS